MINLQNYEEWFLLYTDNELTPVQKKMVEAFVVQHPALQDEFDLLKNTVLDDGIIKENDWEFLLQKEASADWKEKALLDLDGELDEKQQQEWKNILQENNDAQAFHSSLLLTKLPIETIEYPDKERLLRKERKPVIIPIWLRYVSVAAVLTGIAWFAWNSSISNKIDINPTTAFVAPPHSTILDTSKPIVQTQKQNDFSVHKSGKAILDKEDRKENNVVYSDKLESKKEEILDENMVQTSNTNKEIIVKKDIARIENLTVKPTVIPVVAGTIDPKTTAVNIGFANVEASKVNALRSGKRMVALEDSGNDSKMFIANTEINTQKLFGWLKKNKFGKSKENTKKLEIANFEITVKTNQL